MDLTISPGQTVFARWKKRYYYPAIVDEVFDTHVNVTYLDKEVAVVAKEHIIPLQAAFDTLQFQGNWQHGGLYYKGKLASQLPLIMHYNDGDVEQVDLSQLRGTRPELTPRPTPAQGPVKKSKKDPVPIQSEKEAVRELKALRKNGLISKEEFKRMKQQLQ